MKISKRTKTCAALTTLLGIGTLISIIVDQKNIIDDYECQLDPNNCDIYSYIIPNEVGEGAANLVEYLKSLGAPIEM